MKAVIVIDVEEYGDYYADVYRKDADDRFEGRYHLKPLPQKIKGKREKFMPTYSLGWNDCLDAVELGLKPLWEKTE